VFLLLKFCDPHAFDYPYIKEMLDKENIPACCWIWKNNFPPRAVADPFRNIHSDIIKTDFNRKDL